MPTTFTKIASVSVGVLGAASMDFTSIPSTYTDLCVKVSARGTNASTTVEMLVSFNGVSTNLSSKLLYGTGSAVGSVSPSNIAGAISAALDTSSTFGNSEIYIPNYAGSTNKSVSFDSVSENNATTAYQYLTAGLWTNTAAITSVTLTPAASSFAQYSTATLYGINKS
jgi:hypothetical protein